jgi:hypothetical protein
VGLDGKEERTTDTEVSEVWADIAKSNLAAPVKRGYASESGVELCNHETAIVVCAPNVEMFGRLVPKPSFEGWPVVLVIHFTQLGDRFAEYVHRAQRVCRCREPRRDSAHRSRQ